MTKIESVIKGGAVKKQFLTGQSGNDEKCDQPILARMTLTFQWGRIILRSRV